MNKSIQFEMERLQKSISVSRFVEKYVDIPKFLKACKECSNYCTVWSCPEYSFDPIDIWKKYKTLDLILLKFVFNADDRCYNGSKEDKMISVRDMLRLQKNMLLEKTLEIESNTSGSFALAAGSCDLCGYNGNKHICSKTQGEECYHPDKMRYSVEALGGDVVGAAKDIFDVELMWADGLKLPEYYILMGGLLKC